MNNNFQQSNPNTFYQPQIAPQMFQQNNNFVNYQQPYQQQPQQPQSLKQKVELYISCSNLKNLDLLSKSDPCCVLEKSIIQNKKTYQSTFVEVGRTEVIKDNLNPKFKKTFQLEYYFEEVQPLRFLVYDIDNGATKSMSDDDFIGLTNITLGEIIGAKKQTVKKKLFSKSGKESGSITIKAEVIGSRGDDQIEISITGSNLAKKDLFGKSDPFFLIHRQLSDGSFVQVYKSEIIKKTLNPKFKTFTLKSSKLSNGIEGKPTKLKIECFDWDLVGSNDTIGEFYCTLEDIKQQQPNARFQLYEFKKKKNIKKYGGDFIISIKIHKSYSFLDYLKGGCEMSLISSIDFTGSNLNPRKPNSLHYLGQNPNFMNEYEKAIRAIGEILQVYDYDKLFPCYGFGAMLPNKQVSHCFALNGNPNNPNCAGVNGILSAYKQAIYNVQLYGPTYFAPTIKMASKFANEIVCQDVQKYYILLIITDGIINDMDKTIQEIVKASFLPLSIVIVGVGNADFSAMDQLDCDDGLLKDCYNNKACRDIVQFVPFSKYKNSNFRELSKETLAEIPKQVEEYMRSKKIIPNGC